MKAMRDGQCGALAPGIVDPVPHRRCAAGFTTSAASTYFDWRGQPISPKELG